MFIIIINKRCTARKESMSHVDNAERVQPKQKDVDVVTLHCHCLICLIYGMEYIEVRGVVVVGTILLTMF